MRSSHSEDLSGLRGCTAICEHTGRSRQLRQRHAWMPSLVDDQTAQGWVATNPVAFWTSVTANSCSWGQQQLSELGYSAISLQCMQPPHKQHTFHSVRSIPSIVYVGGASTVTPNEPKVPRCISTKSRSFPTQQCNSDALKHQVHRPGWQQNQNVL